MRKIHTLLLIPFLVVSAFAQDAKTVPPSIPLWEKGAPGSEARAAEPENMDKSMAVTNVHNPSITPFLPADGKSTGTAILIAPGGGHRKLCLGHEGYSLARWLADHGVAAFVMKNRLAREEGSTYTIEDHAMADTRRALRTIRSRAEEWKIDPKRLGVMGFSAGGELAAFAAMDSDPGDADATDPVERESCRPDFQALIYPGTIGKFTVSKGAPPAFFACGYKDRPDISFGMAELYLKYKKAEVPAELHIFSNAGHGFGFRPDKTDAAGRWPERLMDWLKDSKLLGK